MEELVAEQSLIAVRPLVSAEDMQDMGAAAIDTAHVHGMVIRARAVHGVSEAVECLAHREGVCATGSTCGHVDDRLGEETGNRGAPDVLDRVDPFSQCGSEFVRGLREGGRPEGVVRLQFDHVATLPACSEARRELSARQHDAARCRSDVRSQSSVRRRLGEPVENLVLLHCTDGHLVGSTGARHPDALPVGLESEGIIVPI